MAAPILNPTNGSSPTMASSLPQEVTACLQNARFLHLATSADNIPHVSLMNYTYLPANSSPFNRSPAIIMTTQPSSTKTSNLASNPRVSLLVHDWVSHRPPTLPESTASGGSALTALLQNLNTASLSRISATINGTAELLEGGSEKEAWFRKKHIENNTFGPSSESQAQAALGLFSSSPSDVSGSLGDDSGDGDGGKKHYVEGSETRVVLVTIKDGRVSDWKGSVQDWKVEEPLMNGT
ncbi:hypothetical protein EJ05DRAFT_386750 [Pseudovirgaria hyperparasitica]|uniref:Pyridoxamine 5'-phosphate oxidase N-terminal domain-containing protein n=1 Tax=Pseudovirgaria hyperparasitica TaxID=470096 RepID=A0A6A6W5V7_9PEZI|nr:uncharacterized protein EJ05DRAFT_386750 [Pseudovirgaria hyperparasitica]KAF2757336.1 hypothetical protein EJ05DRAFT_386750 [Pseudovirgaria hyperparasitica]